MTKVHTLPTALGVIIYPNEVWRMTETEEILLDHIPFGRGALVRPRGLYDSEVPYGDEDQEDLPDVPEMQDE